MDNIVIRRIKENKVEDADEVFYKIKGILGVLFPIFYTKFLK